MNSYLRTFLPFLLIPILIGGAIMVGLPTTQADQTAPSQPLPVAQDGGGDDVEPTAVVVTVEVPVTVEVTRQVTVIVTPTFTPLPPTPTPITPIDTIDDDPFLGSADAPVKVVEFSDYQCGFCARFYDTTLIPLTERYGDLIQFVYRDYPIFGDASVYGALSAECAGDQGKFWEYHNMIFDNSLAEQPLELSVENYEAWAVELELDMDEWNACLLDEATLEEVRNDAVTAQAWGVTGTPAFFINGKIYVGARPLETFIEVIDAELRLLGYEIPTTEEAAE